MNTVAIELCRPNRNANLGGFSGGASAKAMYFAQVAMHSIQPSRCCFVANGTYDNLG